MKNKSSVSSERDSSSAHRGVGIMSTLIISSDSATTQPTKHSKVLNNAPHTLVHDSVQDDTAPQSTTLLGNMTKPRVISDDVTTSPNVSVSMDGGDVHGQQTKEEEKSPGTWFDWISPSQ